MRGEKVVEFYVPTCPTEFSLAKCHPAESSVMWFRKLNVKFYWMT